MGSILCIEPMKINKIPEGKEFLFPSICASGEYFAQLKKDGYWYQFEKDMDGNMHLWSRNVSKITGILTEKSANVPEIIMALEGVPNGTVIIGEIYYPGKRSKDVTPIMGALPELAIERQDGEYGHLHYYVHDMIYYNGHDLTKVRADVRYDLLKIVYYKYSFHAVWEEGAPLVELAERVDDNIQEAVAAALAAGEEGMVLKKRTAPYSPGKRPVWDTIKIKKTDTCDAVIIAACEPTREYTGKELDTWEYWEGDTPITKPYALGWKTAIEIGCYDGDKLISIGTVSSGLTDGMREGLAKHPEDYIGKVCELAGMEKDRTAHTLRHFHFKRIREDKNPKECTIKEIFG